jgi:uncharacterized protein
VQLNGKTVLLTGATGGLGQAIARACHARGPQLILTGRRAEVLEELAAEVGGRVIACDLAEREEADRLLVEAGDVDVFIANAALPASGSLDSFSEEQLDRALDVNLRGPIVMAHKLIEPMRSRGGGHMVFISSLSGKAAAPSSSLYAATKFGLRGFSLGLREDLHRFGIGVSVVNPGFIRDAGMFAESGAKLPPGVGTKTPEDVGAAVVRAIEKDRAEIDVAPIALKLGASAAGMLPGPVSLIQRRLGSDKIAAGVAEGQRNKR